MRSYKSTITALAALTLSAISVVVLARDSTGVVPRAANAITPTSSRSYLLDSGSTEVVVSRGDQPYNSWATISMTSQSIDDRHDFTSNTGSYGPTMIISATGGLGSGSQITYNGTYPQYPLGYTAKACQANSTPSGSITVESLTPTTYDIDHAPVEGGTGGYGTCHVNGATVAGPTVSPKLTWSRGASAGNLYNQGFTAESGEGYLIGFTMIPIPLVSGRGSIAGQGGSEVTLPCDLNYNDGNGFGRSNGITIQVSWTVVCNPTSQ